MNSEFEPAPEAIRDLAESCVRAVHASLGLALDYSQDTLPILDHYARQRIQANDLARAEIIGLLVPMCGAYFGEVVRRGLGDGIWLAPDATYDAFRVLHLDGHLRYNPMGVALEVITHEDAGDMGARLDVALDDRRSIDDAVDTAGPVSPDDYYTFAVRYEVIEHVFSLLAAMRMPTPTSATLTSPAPDSDPSKLN